MLLPSNEGRVFPAPHCQLTILNEFGLCAGNVSQIIKIHLCIIRITYLKIGDKVFNILSWLTFPKTAASIALAYKRPLR